MDKLTQTQRDNLAKLATYLEALPEDYARFDMNTYLGNPGRPFDIVRGSRKYALENGGLPGCGTVACAIGHGPAAGVFVPRKYAGGGVSWYSYANKAFGDVFDWCFEADWFSVDNTPQGAAARIRYLLENGDPKVAITADAVALYAPYRIDRALRARAS